MAYRIGTKAFGDWQIVKVLGEGASGKVYEIIKMDQYFTAENAPRSALKVIRIPKTENDINEAMSEGQNYASISANYQEYRDEIVNEVVLLSKLKSHPNIVSYEDHHVLQQENGIGWDIQIRMELLTSLTNYLIGRSMSETEVLKLAKDLCRALAFCQKEGLIHRDIKPQNIFVSTTGQFKLGDFGVARTIEKTTGSLSLKGTESYMAPEVFQYCPYGKTVDIYSLGLVLYMLLNEKRLPFLPLGEQGFSHKVKENALVRRMQGEVLPLPAHASESMAKVILKACAYKPERRYHTAEEMLQDLEKIRLGEGTWQNVPEPSETENFSEEERTVGRDPYVPPQDLLKKSTEKRKKKKGTVLKVSITAAILMIIGAVVLLFIYPLKNTVMVNNGNGSGKYKKEEIVSIEADKAEEEQLNKFLEKEKTENNFEASLELSSFIGENLSEIRSLFGDISEPVWSMGTLKCSNEWINFESAGDEEIITSIWMDGDGNPYTIYGINTAMSKEEAKKILQEHGFKKMQCNDTFYNENGKFISLDIWDQEGLGIVLSQVAFGKHTEEEEVFSCIGCEIEYILQEIPGLEIREEEGDVYATKKGIEFRAKKAGDNVLHSKVVQITLSGNDCEYCLYGVKPGDEEGVGYALNFSAGGSREYIDPAGNILYLFNVSNQENPSISLRLRSDL